MSGTLKEFDSVSTDKAVRFKGSPVNWFQAKHGYRLTSDGPLVTIEKDGIRVFTPWANVIQADDKSPAPAAPEKPAEKGGAKK